MNAVCSQARPGAIEAYSEAFAHRFMRALDWVADKLDVEVEGLENLPPARGLLVTNHAFGFDAALLMARIEAKSGRRVWVLGEHAWWVIPGLRRLAAAVGTVDGTQENADRLLSADELVLVMPGGAREALKPRELRYRLLWGHRYGFVRAAVRNRAPIVPIASLGPEELFDLVGDPWQRSRRLHLPFPLPRPAHLLPIPRRPPIRYVIGEPIPVDRCRGEDDDVAVRRLRREVEGALHEIFEERLASQAGFSAPPLNGPASG
jgi:1-acyl-sn-glycerol-3-phosphate acyltransferase